MHTKTKANPHYPEHLYNKVRIKVANTYFKREFRKYFHSLRDEKIWGIIDGDTKKPYYLLTNKTKGSVLLQRVLVQLYSYSWGPSSDLLFTNRL